MTFCIEIHHPSPNELDRLRLKTWGLVESLIKTLSVLSLKNQNPDTLVTELYLSLNFKWLTLKRSSLRNLNMAFFSEWLPHACLQIKIILTILLVLWSYFQVTTMLLEFWRVNDAYSLGFQNAVLMVVQSLSDLQHSSSPEVHVLQKAEDWYHFGCSLSHKPEKCIPISNAKLQQEVIFFSLSKKHLSQ